MLIITYERNKMIEILNKLYIRIYFFYRQKPKEDTLRKNKILYLIYISLQTVSERITLFYIVRYILIPINFHNILLNKK